MAPMGLMQKSGRRKRCDAHIGCWTNGICERFASDGCGLLQRHMRQLYIKRCFPRRRHDHPERLVRRMRKSKSRRRGDAGVIRNGRWANLPGLGVVEKGVEPFAAQDELELELSAEEMRWVVDVDVIAK